MTVDTSSTGSPQASPWPDGSRGALTNPFLGSDYLVTLGYIPPNEVWMPNDPAPMVDNRPRFLVPGGGGTLMELGGGSSPSQLMVPAGGGTFRMLP